MSDVHWMPDTGNLGGIKATRENGDRLSVRAAPVWTPDHWVWEVLVTSESGCCEYLTELEDIYGLEAVDHAEGVDLYADATGTDFDDCPNCKH